MSAGRLIAVVGASGVGKDTLIDALLRVRPSLHRVRRTVTREADAGGERIDAVTPAAFEALRAGGAFRLDWKAHGHRYGILAALVRKVAEGREAVANLSRGALPEAANLFPRLAVLRLTASPATLARRLGARGREDAVAERPDRAGTDLPALPCPVATVANDGPFEDTLAAAFDVLYPERG